MIWLWWIGAALILGVIEMATADLTFLMLAGGALGGALTAALGGPVWVQVIVFAVVATALLVAVRPWAKRHLAATTPEMRTNAEARVGREATALTVVDARDGRINLDGEEWSARLADAPEAYGTNATAHVDPGAGVRVVAIDGAVAVVVPLPPRR
ncbi:MAG: NfeD family protein [Actinomyces ruminicola]|uniref:Membrane protein implicated in regulation of membrane protease activity n=1 Tax=Actinomyces ruminicola TaxID=332524 RepID=A0A1G9VQC2_9ACTO|nr:NfeD family protein [Actinomyces ruminicola]MBE6482378.1 NfeD family protein [Actinomyces ruminicola]SDM74356.1 Membrane protein implicated in regulation of membrane protease activity [Actinomyces ruminicola]